MSSAQKSSASTIFFHSLSAEIQRAPPPSFSSGSRSPAASSLISAASCRDFASLCSEKVTPVRSRLASETSLNVSTGRLNQNMRSSMRDAGSATRPVASCRSLSVRGTGPMNGRSHGVLRSEPSLSERRIAASASCTAAAGAPAGMPSTRNAFRAIRSTAGAPPCDSS